MTIAVPDFIPGTVELERGHGYPLSDMSLQYCATFGLTVLIAARLVEEQTFHCALVFRFTKESTV